ncbi:FAD-dependent oxidoreductase [Nocardia sp. CDC160]|uniref:FAD-dependent oxidoreductase n=1 Tax=Nocardia sp. CDC160 TaxID=3112166 RepID=UPI002DC0354D|nr:FAD-dependent oxidoreductase [Nocardia sp. CDC160]MEC3919279.1 FAD-dependent oxidoreductase [Nocardia sp. CDC160]
MEYANQLQEDLMETDIVIVGAGPTGLMLAAELRLAGVDVLLVERRPEIGGTGRAGGVQSRTLEIFDQRGLLEPLLAAGDYPSNAGHFAGIGFEADSLDNRLIGKLIPQARIEAMLADRAVASGARVRRENELVALNVYSDGVSATITDGEGQYRVRARHLVAADGAHSTTRSLLGLDFPGTPATHVSTVADVWLTDADRYRTGGVHWRWDDAGNWTMLLPFGDHFRIAFGGPGHPDNREAPIAGGEIDTALATFDPGLGLAETRYGFRITDTARQLLDYRHGHVFFAGDAAHVHPPFGGQGMNLGIQDAFNLGWKLAATLRGDAGDDLLDTYNAERHPIGARVLFNVRAQNALMNHGAADSQTSDLRALFTELMHLPDTRNYLAEMLSGHAVRYSMPADVDHPLLGLAAPDCPLPGAAGRLFVQMRSGRGVLIAGSDVVAAAGESWSDQVDIVRTSTPLSLLVRPDGYICWATSSVSIEADDVVVGLRSVLTRWFGHKQVSDAVVPVC